MSETYFFDTNVLLETPLEQLPDLFYISEITLREIENIKTNFHKDELIKCKARQVARYLATHNNYEVLTLTECQSCIDVDLYGLSKISPDEVICQMAAHLSHNLNAKNVIFCTYDVNCYNLAKKIFGLNAQYGFKTNDDFNYKGYKTVVVSEKELDYFYEHLRENTYDLNINEYIYLVDEEGKHIDTRRWTGDIYQEVFNKSINVNLIHAKIKAKDEYQKMAIDSIYNNSVTFISGKPGSGKTLLALTSALNLIENNKYKRLIIMFNPTKVRGSVELGYYKGDVVDKAKQSSIGQILLSKLGESVLDSLIAGDRIRFLPISDCRGVQINHDEICTISESQNMSRDMMKLCLQRVEEGAKIIVEGDYNAQLDDNYFAGDNNGMISAIKALTDTDIFGYVDLPNIHRSKLATLIDKI